MNNEHPSRLRRSGPIALLSAAALVAASQLAIAPAMADDTDPAPALQARGNGGWAYDSGALPYSPGQWANTINTFNASVSDPTHRFSKISSYGTDMEMYCPDNDGTRCTINDLDVYYTPGGEGPRSTAAYAANVTGPFAVEPIIDGRIDNGYLQGFNELSQALASAYADKVAAQVCADQNIMGIQFDNEPFDVSTQNGQYWFYLQIAKNFAGQHSATAPNDPYGCVSAQHPQGRVFSVFTFARVLKPGTQSAQNMQDIMSSYDNGYVIDSLYDLGDNPAAYLNDPDTYRDLVREEASNMREWSNLAGVHYAYGIPATASAHEYTTCQGFCVAAPNGGTGYPMIEYTRAAVEAIYAAGAPQDDLFIGTDVWQYGSVTRIGQSTLLPSTIPADVNAYLAAHLPGPGSTQDAVADGTIPVKATVPQGDAGSLTMTIADYGSAVVLSGPDNQGDRLRFDGSLPAITVTDSRNASQAGDGGWAVSGQAATFSASSTRTVTADHFGWTPSVTTPKSGVDAGSSTPTVLSGGSGLAQPSRLAAATSEGRSGSTELGAALFLEVPVDTAPGTYTGTLTVSLFAVD